MGKTLGSSMGNVGRMLGEALRERGSAMAGAITEKERKRKEQKDQLYQLIFGAAGKGLLTSEQASQFGGQVEGGGFEESPFAAALAGGAEQQRLNRVEAARVQREAITGRGEAGDIEAMARTQAGITSREKLAESKIGEKETEVEKKARKKREALGQAIGSARFDASFKYQRGKLESAVTEQEKLLKALKDTETLEDKWSELFPSQEFAQVFPDGVKSEEVDTFRVYVGKQLAQRKNDLDKHDEWLVSTRPRFGQTPESYQQTLIKKNVSLELQEELFRKYASTLGVTQDEITEHFTAIQPGSSERGAGGLESQTQTDTEMKQAIQEMMRLKPGMTREQAEADLTRLMQGTPTR